MRKTPKVARIFVVGMFVLLFMSGIALLLLQFVPGFVEYFPFLLWIHILIIASGFYGIWRNWKLSHATSSGFIFFIKGFPAWLLALAIPVCFAITPLLSLPSTDLGTTAEGEKIFRRSWSAEHGRYFVRINNGKPVEISSTEYDEHQRQSFKVFASAWVLFSYLLLVLWHYLWRCDVSIKAESKALNSPSN
jgi:hypothetical protein